MKLIDNLFIDGNATIMRRKMNARNDGRTNTSKVLIEQLITLATNKKKGNLIESELRQIFTIAHKELLYSYAFFRTSRKPVFFREDSVYINEVIGFILIVEYEDYIIIVKKYAENINPKLDQKFEHLSEEDKFSKFNENATVNSLNLKNTINTETGVTTTNVSALGDLARAYQPLNASALALGTTHYTKDGVTTRVSPINSNIAQSTGKGNLDLFFNWIISITNKLNELPSSVERYTDCFSKKINFNSSFYISNGKMVLLSEPKTLYLDFSEIRDEINKHSHFYKNEEGKSDYTIINRSEILNFIDSIETFSDITVNQNTQKFDTLNSAGIELKILKNRFTIISKKISMYSWSNGDLDDKTKLLNSLNKSFRVYFEDHELVFMDGILHKTNLTTFNLNWYTGIFEPSKLISSISSEKGNNLDAKSVEFSSGSLFSFIEDRFSDDDIIICEDLAPELCDYLTVNRKANVVRQIHAKSGEGNLPPGQFEQIVSQATKNLGFLSSFNSYDFKNKEQRWDKDYSRTQIKRIRKGGESKDVVAQLETMKEQHRINKEVYLVVDFLSYKSLVDEINKLSSSKNSHTSKVTPLIWMIGTLNMLCAEHSISLKIITKF